MTRMLAAMTLVVGTVMAAARPVAAQATTPDAGIASQATAPAAQPAPAPVTAAATTVAPVQGENAVSRFGPTVDGAKLLAPARATNEQNRLGHEPAYRNQAPGVALMIVGGAVFLGGAIIAGQAGDALMVGGVVVAAIGLYQYLQ